MARRPVWLVPLCLVGTTLARASEPDDDFDFDFEDHGPPDDSAAHPPASDEEVAAEAVAAALRQIELTRGREDRGAITRMTSPLRKARLLVEALPAEARRRLYKSRATPDTDPLGAQIDAMIEAYLTDAAATARCREAVGSAPDAPEFARCTDLLPSDLFAPVWGDRIERPEALEAFVAVAVTCQERRIDALIAAGKAETAVRLADHPACDPSVAERAVAARTKECDERVRVALSAGETDLPGVSISECSKESRVAYAAAVKARAEADRAASAAEQAAAAAAQTACDESVAALLAQEQWDRAVETANAGPCSKGARDRAAEGVCTRDVVRLFGEGRTDEAHAWAYSARCPPEARDWLGRQTTQAHCATVLSELEDAPDEHTWGATLAVLGSCDAASKARGEQVVTQAIARLARGSPCARLERAVKERPTAIGPVLALVADAALQADAAACTQWAKDHPGAPASPAAVAYATSLRWVAAENALPPGSSWARSLYRSLAKAGGYTGTFLPGTVERFPAWPEKLGAGDYFLQKPSAYPEPPKPRTAIYVRYADQCVDHYEKVVNETPGWDEVVVDWYGGSDGTLYERRRTVSHPATRTETAEKTGTTCTTHVRFEHGPVKSDLDIDVDLGATFTDSFELGKATEARWPEVREVWMKDGAERARARLAAATDPARRLDAAVQLLACGGDDAAAWEIVRAAAPLGPGEKYPF